jgi:DNA helicase-2/ATP-dependent DNA helicase PcrA
MSLLEELNPQQRRAVIHDGPPLLILAGAGSGKTRVITSKIVYLLEEKDREPRSILAVTFTNRAANEMKERTLAQTPRAPNVMIRTFHSFGAWLLRRHTHLMLLNAYFNIYDDEDSFSLLKRAVEEQYEKGAFDRGRLKKYARLISLAKDKGLGPEDDLSVLSEDTRLGEIYGLYQAKLAKTGNADFGDLILGSVALLRDNPEVKRRIQDRFRVILVDEYQDANTAQFLLLKELYRESNYLCVVGDEDQSIYRFRGAEVMNIINFSKDSMATEIIRLEQNYRSTGRILSAATGVVEKNQERLGKELWTRNDLGDSISLAYAENEEDEARLCAQIISDGHYKSTAILYRNNYQSRPFEMHFMKLGIPYRILGSLRFSERAEVKDALAYLNLLNNPRDELSFVRILNKPSRGIGKISLEKILSRPKADLLARAHDALPELSKKAARSLSGFLDMMSDLSQRLITSTLAEFLLQLIHHTGLYELYEERDDVEGTTRAQNLEELVNAAVGFGAGKKALSSFIDTLVLSSSSEAKEQTQLDSEERVNLITVHNTKGLEFDRVIITGLEDGLFPHYRDTLFKEDLELEEERRLFYVALTRTRRHLYLTSCKRRRTWGRTHPCAPSRFLSEIPSDLLETQAIEEFDDEFYVGCGVYHNDYGPGAIQKKWRNGPHTVVLVEFLGGKKAQFILKYADLEKIALDE